MSICDVPVLSSVCQSVGEGAATLVSAPFDYLAAGTGAVAQLLFGTMWTLLDKTTLVDLTNPGYVDVYDLLFGVAAVLVVIFFLAQVITGMIRRDPGALARAALGAGKAVLGAFLVLTLAGLLLQVTDELTLGVVQAAGMSMDQLGARLGALFSGLTLISVSAPGAGAIITIFLACLAIAATAIVWFSLLVRKALLLAAVVLAPVALTGSAWDATRAWFGRWASFVLALIVSKLVVVVIFLVAVVQMDAPIDLDLQSISDPLAGVVLMAAAAFAPYLVYKLIAWSGLDMYHSISIEQEAKQALNRPLPTLAPLPTRWPTRGGADTSPPPATPTAGTAPSGAATTPTTAGSGASGGAAGGTTAGGAGAGGSAAGGAAAGAAAAAGPAAIAVVGAELARSAAQAGPRAGGSVGQAVDSHAGAAANQPADPPPAPPRPAPSSPATSDPVPPQPPRAPQPGQDEP